MLCEWKLWVKSSLCKHFTFWMYGKKEEARERRKQSSPWLSFELWKVMILKHKSMHALPVSFSSQLDEHCTLYTFHKYTNYWEREIGTLYNLCSLWYAGYSKLIIDCKDPGLRVGSVFFLEFNLSSWCKCGWKCSKWCLGTQGLR